MAGQRLLRRVQAVSRVLPRQHVADRFGRIRRPALREHVRPFVLLADEAQRWLAALDPDERMALGRPPNDEIWVPALSRLAARSDHAIFDACTNNLLAFRDKSGAWGIAEEYGMPRREGAARRHEGRRLILSHRRLLRRSTRRVDRSWTALAHEGASTASFDQSNR